MKLKKYSSREELENKLAEQIASDLHESIFKHGSTSMLVSGGSTPIHLYDKLSHFRIQWDLVTIALVDERFVPTTSEFSNEALIKEHLLKNFASRSKFIGLVHNDKNEAKNLLLAQANYQTIFQNPISVSILGMGEDGHTASLFPGDTVSELDLKLGNKADVLSTKAPQNPTKRITCNKSSILQSEHIYVFISGKNKLKVIENDPDEILPISYLKNEHHVNIYYTEQT